MKNPEVLKIMSLSGDWCDKDIIMLHACFQLLVDCIDQENLLTGQVDWEYNEDYNNAKKEIKELYDWWIERKNTDFEKEINDLDKDQYTLDNEMLIRLIKVRKYLWT